MVRFLLTFILFGCVQICSAREVRDTLWTIDNDRIILTYEMRYSDDGVNIRFLDVKKKLGKINSKRYKRLEDVEVIFFDRTGVYEDMAFTNMMPEAFMVPSNLKYSKSDLGYFSLQDHPSLYFKIVGFDKENISIPLYLAYYEGKGERKLFSVCKKFNVLVKTPEPLSPVTERRTISEPVISVVEIEADNEKAIEVATQINAIMALLEVQEKLPFADGLQYEITYLRNMQKEVTDIQLLSKIKECLTSCELKKIELETRASLEAQRAQAEAENLARQELEREQIRQDSIAVAQQQQVQAEKKRNIWMIVGGVILAIACFVGNQVFQHFRNLRNQRNMMEIQQDMARQAENEAKRYAQNYARRKTNEAVVNARISTQDMVRNKVKQSVGKTNKHISI